MWDDLWLLPGGALECPICTPLPPTIPNHREDCRVQATSPLPSLTPYDLDKDLGVFRAGSPSLGTLLILLWDLENLHAVCSSLVETHCLPQEKELARTSLKLSPQQLPPQGKVPVLFPFSHQQPWLLGSRRLCTHLEGAPIPGSC